MTDQEAPQAPTDTLAPSAPAAPDGKPVITPVDGSYSQEQVDEAPARMAELEPTIRDHAERLQLTPLQVGVVIARLHGAHDEDGKRRFPAGVSHVTRMSADDFDAALQVALHGRI